MKVSVIFPIGRNVMEFDRVTSIFVNLDDKDIYKIEFMDGDGKRTETLNFKDLPKGTILEICTRVGRRTDHEGK